MATAAQRDIVQRHVDEAVAAGARVTTGGKPTGVGTFFQPTVLADVDQSMSCMTEETFGPTLPVVKVADEDEAIRLANDSRYGLSATVWTGDVGARRAGGASARGRCGQRQRRDGQRLQLRPADAGLEALGHRIPQRRCRRHTEILPPTSDHGAADPYPVARSCSGIPYSRRKFRMSMGVVRAAAAHGCDGSASSRGEAPDEVSGGGSARRRPGLGGQEITLDPPHEGEVLVKMAVAGVCHSDDHFATGDMVPTPELRGDDGGHGRTAAWTTSRCSAVTKARAWSRRSVRVSGPCNPVITCHSRSSRRAGPAGGACRA